MEEKEDILWRLYAMIADINVSEITNQISRDNLSNWCNSWRIAAKEVGRNIGVQFRGVEDIIPPEKKCIDFDSFVSKYDGVLKYNNQSVNLMPEVITTPHSESLPEQPFCRTNAIGFDPTKETPRRGLL